MSVMRKWSILTGVAVVAVLAAGWFLLVSPKNSDASAVRGQVAQEDSKAAALQTKIAMLKAQSQNLPQLAAQLATIRLQLPSDPQLPKLVRDLSGSAKSSGATIVSLAPSAPVALAPATPTAATGTASAAAPVASGSTAASSASANTVYQVPLVVKVSGSYFELEQFLNQVEGLKRAFLTTGVDISSDATPGSSSGSTGDLVMTLTGRVFVVPPATTATTATTPQAVTPAPAK